MFRTLENGHSIRHQSIPPLSTQDVARGRRKRLSEKKLKHRCMHLAREPVYKPGVGPRFAVDLSVFPQKGPNQQKNRGVLDWSATSGRRDSGTSKCIPRLFRTSIFPTKRKEGKNLSPARLGLEVPDVLLPHPRPA